MSATISASWKVNSNSEDKDISRLLLKYRREIEHLENCLAEECRKSKREISQLQQENAHLHRQLLKYELELSKTHDNIIRNNSLMFEYIKNLKNKYEGKINQLNKIIKWKDNQIMYACAYGIESKFRLISQKMKISKLQNQINKYESDFDDIIDQISKTKEKINKNDSNNNNSNKKYDFNKIIDRNDFIFKELDLKNKIEISKTQKDGIMEFSE